MVCGGGNSSTSLCFGWYTTLGAGGSGTAM
jgi:hypothetical protein